MWFRPKPWEFLIPLFPSHWNLIQQPVRPTLLFKWPNIWPPFPTFTLVQAMLVSSLHSCGNILTCLFFSKVGQLKSILSWPAMMLFETWIRSCLAHGSDHTWVSQWTVNTCCKNTWWMNVHSLCSTPRLAHFLSKRSGAKYFHLCRKDGLCCTCSPEAQYHSQTVHSKNEWDYAPIKHYLQK